MLIHSFEGPMGSGMTLTAVNAALEQSKLFGKKVVSNNRPWGSTEYFTREVFLEKVDKVLRSK